MNKYECVILVNPTLKEEKLNDVKTKVFNLIKDNGGSLHYAEEEYEYVLKKTAYEVKSFNKAQYLVFQFEIEGNLIKELERNFRITDDIIKFLIVKLNGKEELIKKFKEDGKDIKTFKQENTSETKKTEEVVEETTEEEVNEEVVEEATEEKEETKTTENSEEKVEDKKDEE